MEDEDLKKQQKQAETDEASQKTAHVAGKAASEYFAPGAGGKIYDLASKTKAGQAVENAVGKSLQKQPLMNPVMRSLNKSGALDAADKGIDLASGSGGIEEGLNATGSTVDLGKGLEVAGSLSPDNKNENKESNSDSQSQESEKQSSTFDNIKKSKKMIPIIAAVVASILIIILIIVAASSVLAPINTAIKYVQGFWNNFVDFIIIDQHDREEAYYEKLKAVQKEMSDNNNGICIDINLITASLSVEYTFDEILLNGESNKDENDNTMDYKRMEKQIELLAKMQIKTKKYGWDSSLGDTHCSDTNNGYILVTPENIDNFSDDNILLPANGKDSSTAELVARHDRADFFALFTKEATDETNEEYYIYRPPFSDKKDVNGNIIGKECKVSLPADKQEMSIGNYETRKDSVYYWNLVNSFIPSYYKEYLPADEVEKQEKIIEIADEIYLLYEQLGPSQMCTNVYVGPSTLCPNGITVVDKEGNASVFDLEEYVAGVVSNEAYASEGMEALKAQAVAARTYALNYTNYCTQVISNSTNAQTFTQNINDRAREATKATLGEILTYNGNIFSSQYDSFCYDDDDCPDAKKNADGTYSVTYTKVPNGEKHTVTLSDSAQFGRITYGQGHAHGMSQLVSYQLAKEGKTYQEILSYFYSNGINIDFIEPIGGSAGSVAGGSTEEKLAYLFPSGLPSSNSEAYTYMTTVEFNVVDINGNRSTKKATVHQAVAQDFVDIMNKIADSGFPIKDVGCYNWRSAAGSSSRSHHSYGVACDLNVKENYMIKGDQILAGSYYRPGTDPYSFPADGVVVKTFAEYGWGWGGSWSSSKDYMHFSFTGK